MAVTLRLTTFVTNAGVPVTGLAGANLPEITIWNADSGAVVQAATDGTEIAGGFYGFDFVPTAGLNYAARWDNDPQAVPQVTPQERYLSSSFGEFFDDVVPEGGSDDYGTLIQRLDTTTQDSAFGDAVHIDTVNGASGTAFPLGTPTDPVDNLANALTVAAARGLRRFVVAGTLTLAGALTDWRVEGVASNNAEAILNLNGQNIAGSEFTNIALSGNSSGLFTALRCELFGTMDGIQGFFRDCTLLGTLTPAANQSLWLLGCYSGIAGLSTPILDLSNMTTGGSVNVRTYSGGMDVRSCNVGAFEASFEFVGGQIILAATLTAGTFAIRGAVNITDSSSGATIVVEAALARTPIQALILSDATPFAGADIASIKSTGQTSAFGDAVYIDTDNGAAGTAFPLGTPTSPVDNLADALTIAAANNLRRFFVTGLITLTAALTDWRVEGSAPINVAAQVNLNGQSVSGTDFTNISLTGSSTGVFTARRCQFIGAMSGAQGIFERCTLFGSLTPPTSSTLSLLECSSATGVGDGPVIDLTNVNFNSKIFVHAYSGNLELRNCSEANYIASLAFVAGDLLLAASITAGTFKVRGVVNITDSGSATVVTEAALARTPIQDLILSDSTPFQGADIADILVDTGTTIPALIAALNDPSAATIADAVWTEIIATHDSAGTAAEGLEKVRKVTTNRVIVSLDNQTVTVYEDDDTTPAFSFTISSDLRQRDPV